MDSFMYGITLALGLASLGCFLFVLYTMFQYKETMIAIACLIGIFLCGIGGFVAFIYGWIRSGDWEMRSVMIIWSVVVLLQIGVAVLRAALAA